MYGAIAFFSNTRLPLLCVFTHTSRYFCIDFSCVGNFVHRVLVVLSYIGDTFRSWNFRESPTRRSLAPLPNVRRLQNNFILYVYNFLLSNLFMGRKGKITTGNVYKSGMCEKEAKSLVRAPIEGNAPFWKGAGRGTERSPGDQ